MLITNNLAQKISHIAKLTSVHKVQSAQIFQKPVKMHLNWRRLLFDYQVSPSQVLLYNVEV
jgi:hypothetical protein